MDINRNTTIIVKTFERPRCLNRLLKSISAFFPGIQVLIADDSRNPYASRIAKRHARLDTKVFIMPFDSGVSAGRNLLLHNVKTPFFVHCDDDFIFDERTDLNQALSLLQTRNLDILGGLYYDVAPLSAIEMAKDITKMDFYRIKQLFIKHGVSSHFMGNFIDNADGSVTIEFTDYSPPVTICDFVQNFFVARTQIVLEKIQGWDENIKIGGDHEDFFYRASRAGMRIGHTEPFGVVHYPERPKNYAGFRARAKFMRPKRFGRWKESGS